MTPRPHRYLLLALPLLFPLLSWQEATTRAKPSPNPQIEAQTWDAVIREGKENSRVMKHLDVLTNRIGPRLTGSDNLTNAAEWARDYLISLGYENARIEKWGEFPVGFNRGPWAGKVIEPASLEEKLPTGLEFVTRAWSAGTKGTAQGEVILKPGDLMAAKENAAAYKGKWILGSLGGGRRFSAGNRQMRKFLEEAGALGFIAPSRNELLITSGSYRIQWDKLPATPSVSLQKSQYEAILSQVESGRKVVLRFDIRNHFKKGPIPLYNVIADLPGSEHPEQYVVLGGHLDSWDGATGATDNGTGASTTIEAARILKAVGAKPKRTIRFILFSGEEQGLLGSQAYVKKHRKDILENCSACFVHDGGTNFVSGAQGADNIQAVLAQAFQGFGTIDSEFKFEVGKRPFPISGSDHWSWHAIGVPGIFYEQAGRANYNHTHHTQHDTYDSAIPEYQRQTATVMALTGLSVANLPDLFPRHDPSKMRAAMRRRGRMSLDAEMKGNKIVKAQPGSMPARLGLEKGDVILEFAGAKFKVGERAFRNALMGWFQGGAEDSKILVRRKGREVHLPLSRRMLGRRGQGKRRQGQGRQGPAGKGRRDAKQAPRKGAEPKKKAVKKG